MPIQNTDWFLKIVASKSPLKHGLISSKQQPQMPLQNMDWFLKTAVSKSLLKHGLISSKQQPQMPLQNTDWFLKTTASKSSLKHGLIFSKQQPQIPLQNTDCFLKTVASKCSFKTRTDSSLEKWQPNFSKIILLTSFNHASFFFFLIFSPLLSQVLCNHGDGKKWQKNVSFFFSNHPSSPPILFFLCLSFSLFLFLQSTGCLHLSS